MDPPLKRRRFRVDHGLVVAWVLVYRLPYFMKSQLFLEYRFAFELLTGQCLAVLTGILFPLFMAALKLIAHSSRRVPAIVVIGKLVTS